MGYRTPVGTFAGMRDTRPHRRATRWARSGTGRLPSVALAAVIAILAACGGDEQLSRAEYERELRETEREVQAGLEPAGVEVRNLATGSGSLDDAAQAVEEAGDVLTRRADTLREVDPPDGAEEGNRLLVEGLEELAAELSDFQDAADDGDVARLRAFIMDFDDLDSIRKIEEAMRTLEAAGYSVDIRTS